MLQTFTLTSFSISASKKSSVTGSSNLAVCKDAHNYSLWHCYESLFLGREYKGEMTSKHLVLIFLQKQGLLCSPKEETNYGPTLDHLQPIHLICNLQEGQWETFCLANKHQPATRWLRCFGKTKILKVVAAILKETLGWRTTLWSYRI